MAWIWASTRPGGAAARAGEPVYQLAVGAGKLPFTYPPATLLGFEALSRMDNASALNLVNAASLVALAAVVWLTFGLLGYARTVGRLGATLGVTGVSLWTEPVVSNLAFGQINILVMLLVVGDLSLRDDRWFKGDRHRARDGGQAHAWPVCGLPAAHPPLPRRLLACAFTGLLVSPVSWSHHWVWLAPALVVLIDAVRRAAAGRSQALVAVLPVAAVAIFLRGRSSAAAPARSCRAASRTSCRATATTSIGGPRWGMRWVSCTR